MNLKFRYPAKYKINKFSITGSNGVQVQCGYRDASSYRPEPFPGMKCGLELLSCLPYNRAAGAQ